MSEDDLRFKRVIRKFEYLSEELNDLENLKSKADIEFNGALSGTKEKERFAPKKIDTSHIDIEDLEDEFEEREEVDKDTKKLFRKIVSKTHPDRLDKELSKSEKEEARELYETAVEAYNEGEITPLIFAAVKLGLDVSPFKENIKEIEETCEVLQKRINQIQATSAWYYAYVLKGEKEKEKFINDFVAMTKENNLSDSKSTD